MASYKPAKALTASATKKFQEEKQDISTLPTEITDDALAPKPPRMRRGTRPAAFRNKLPKPRK
jgi:hypothetical protein